MSTISKVQALWVAGFCFMAQTASAQLPSPLRGEPALEDYTNAVLAGCSAPGTRMVGGSGFAEAAVLGGGLKLAATTQPPSSATGWPTSAESLLVALDAVAVAADVDSTAQCGGLAAAGAITVSDQNGVAGIQCPGCAGTSYAFFDWTDLWRVLFTGMHHGAGADVSQRDCNSDVRHALASQWYNTLRGRLCFRCLQRAETPVSTGRA